MKLRRINEEQSYNPKNSSHIYFKIFAVVSAYWVISISIVIINKTLFSSSIFGLKAPIFITWLQSIIAVIVCFIWYGFSRCFPNYFSFPSFSILSLRSIRDLLPISFLYVCSIGFSNLALSFVEVSFYFISRSLTTVFNIIFTYLILNKKTSLKALICCFFVILGYLLGVSQEEALGTLSLKGTVFGVLSSLSISLYSIYIKKVLSKVNEEVVLLMFYNNLYGLLLCVPLIYFNNEVENIIAFDFLDFSFWILTFVSGVFGFSNGFISNLQIKFTSPLSHNISGTAKACAQTIIATYWYKETKSFLWWLSTFIILAGSAAYARVRQLEMALQL